MALAGCLLYLVYLPDHILALNTKDNLEMVWRPDREHNVLKTKNINTFNFMNILLTLNHSNVLLTSYLLKLLVETGVLKTYKKLTRNFHILERTY